MIDRFLDRNITVRIAVQYLWHKAGGTLNSYSFGIIAEKGGKGNLYMFLKCNSMGFHARIPSYKVSGVCRDEVC